MMTKTPGGIFREAEWRGQKFEVRKAEDCDPEFLLELFQECARRNASRAKFGILRVLRRRAGLPETNYEKLFN